MGEHTKKEQPEEKKRKLEDSCEAEWDSTTNKEKLWDLAKEKKWEETAGKKNREIKTIKKYLLTKNHPGDNQEEHSENADLNVETPANSRDDLACKPANVSGK